MTEARNLTLATALGKTMDTLGRITVGPEIGYKFQLGGGPTLQQDWPAERGGWFSPGIPFRILGGFFREDTREHDKD